MALAVLAIFISSAQAVINIDEATIQNGQVFIAGDQAPKRTAILWEGVAVGKNTTAGGAFTFNTINLPPDCVGQLTIGTEERDVVINNCTPVDITVIKAGVLKTGQTTSFAAGDDGALEKGAAPPNPRFTDNGNGTITDNLTGLIWLKNANCFGVADWATAISDANTLASGACGLTDGSVAGDWRLPNPRELHSLVDYGVNATPTLPDGHPFSNFGVFLYWSSTTRASSTTFAWHVNFFNGYVTDDGKSAASSYHVIAVRGGS